MFNMLFDLPNWRTGETLPGFMFVSGYVGGCSPGRRTLDTDHKRGGTSKYMPHQGAQERARRLRQKFVAEARQKTQFEDIVMPFVQSKSQAGREHRYRFLKRLNEQGRGSFLGT